MDDLICVQDTKLAEYFENVGKNTVFLLNQETAKKVWDTEIHSGSRTFFHLPDNCWIVPTPNTPRIGDWIEAYNNNNNAVVEELLRRVLDWPDVAIIRFFVSNTVVLQTRWCDFLRFWDEFLAFEDDCPIIIPEDRLAKEAIIFTPLGAILKIEK